MRKIAKYIEISTVSFLSSSIYSREVFSSIIFLVIILFIFFSLWRTIFSTTSSIQDFTLSKMLWYLASTELLMLSGSRIMRRVNEEIRSGNVSNLLTKPFYYSIFLVCDSLGISIFKFIIKMPFALILTFLFTLKLEVSIAGLCSYLLLGFLGLILDAEIIILIGLLSFFIEDTQPVFWIYNKILFTIGGFFLPIGLMPSFFKKLALYLPFKFVLYGPSYSFVNFSVNFFLNSLIGVTGSVLLVFLLIFIVFRTASRRLSINGG